MNRILVIEDELQVQANVQEILELGGFDVITAPNGYIGLKLAQERMPDLIICDVMMPQLSGYEVLTTLWQNITTANIPFIFLTAMTDKVDVSYAMELGADDYFIKPFEPEELLRAVEIRLDKYVTRVEYHIKKVQFLRTETYSRLPISKWNFYNLNDSDLESRLRRAIAQEEFQIYYQPQANLYNGAIIGVEALLRWPKGDGTFIPPNQFIPIAEETGLIIPLGDWLFNKISLQASLWRQANLIVPKISVNLSVNQFKQSKLSHKIAQFLTKANLEPQLLELELTESLFIENQDHLANSLYELKDMGVQISVDDFGTGYPSLEYLKNLPLNSLKIDPCIFRNVTPILPNAATIAAIIEMAHTLRLSVIAEGVETQKELEFLRMQSCDAIQGYFLSPPISVFDLEKIFFSAD